MAELQRINHRHEQIINWLISNPERNLGACAEFFQYTQPWLTQIIHSDMFQVAYRERCREVGVAAVHTIKSRLTAVAALALDRMQAKLEDPNASDGFVLESSETVLKALGYAPGSNGNSNGANGSQHLHLHVDAATLTAARERAAQRYIEVPVEPAPQDGGNGNGDATV